MHDNPATLRGPSACLVVQPHDGRDAGVCKVLVVVLGREGPVPPEVLRHRGGSREGQQLAGDHPVEVAILDLCAGGLLSRFSGSVSDGAWQLRQAIRGEGHRGSCAGLQAMTAERGEH